MSRPHRANFTFCPDAPATAGRTRKKPTLPLGLRPKQYFYLFEIRPRPDLETAAVPTRLIRFREREGERERGRRREERLVK